MLVQGSQEFNSAFRVLSAVTKFIYICCLVFAHIGYLVIIHGSRQKKNGVSYNWLSAVEMVPQKADTRKVFTLK